MKPLHALDATSTRSLVHARNAVLRIRHVAKRAAGHSNRLRAEEDRAAAEAQAALLAGQPTDSGAT